MKRLNYIDWMRGLACVLMFQTHAYDSWLGPEYRQSAFFGYSQLLGSLPAPLFIFLAGVSLALGIDRLTTKGVAAADITKGFARRGLGILGAGLLFRVQEYALAYPWAPWTDLLRVDVLNMIGLSLAAAAVVPLLARGHWSRVIVSGAIAIAIALAAPPLFTTHKPTFLPWWLASYLNGGHTDYDPKGWAFPLFPWSAFAFAGCAAGLVLMRGARLGRERATVLMLGGAGVVIWLAGHFLDALPVQLYAVYDFWRFSPNFFLERVGVLLLILVVVYGWCALKPGKLWSPIQQLGMTSLLVYWVHIEFVYGRFIILPRHANSIVVASAGLAIIIVAMTLLSLVRTRMKRQAPQARTQTA